MYSDRQSYFIKFAIFDSHITTPLSKCSYDILYKALLLIFRVTSTVS
nr:MAG TPA: hypothetical protein [Crassvirales sp.]